jgi:hypothetical protein
MGGIVGPRSAQDIKLFLNETTGLPVLGLDFERTADRHLAMRCEYKNLKGETQKKRIELGFTGLSLHDEVVELSVIMSEWMAHGQNHMMELLHG